MKIKTITSEEEANSCFPIMKALRPHLTKEGFINQWKRQQTQGYRMAAVVDDNEEISALAGYRFAEFLAWGKVIYLDDLITDPSKKRNGYAGVLLDWLEEEGKLNNCDTLQLDSGHQRNDAHRLYLNKGWTITSHHFSKSLNKA
ncbi:MAG: GNAT family N-acetyltransferase [Verrucomicrobia bacterium]|nr:GNAT family N-acetyltransferase [Verrucomicrobiota bacterium]MDA1068282.1 GNAT family N-acetyltransferase [Verrucomicrobiota bacterium]